MLQYVIWNGEEAVREIGDEVGWPLAGGGEVDLERRVKRQACR